MSASKTRGRTLIHTGRRSLVYRGRRSGGGVILKVPRPGSDLAEARAALTREYELLRSVADSPDASVSAALGLEETSLGSTLILADAGPQNLSQVMDRRPLPIDEFLPLAIELTRAVSSLHRHHILHRDINPSNVVIDESGHPTLVDFDAATCVVGSALSSESGRLLGTLHYLAPEQTGRMSRGADHRADLYSLGATFYEMLTGAPPFPLSDPNQLVHAHLARTPVPPSEVNREVPRLLSDITLVLLAKSPEDRYQSADGLLADLERAQRRWQRSGQIPPFELRQRDAGHSLEIPDRLFGRERELEVLTGALARAAGGAAELAVVRGPAGMGKSSLVRRLGSAPRGHMVSGKSNAMGGDVPYAPWRDVLKQALADILDEPPLERAGWRARLLDTVGQNAAALTRLLPELDALLGEQPSLPLLTAPANETRFHLALIALLRTLSETRRPLTVFLDDFQWVDPASLKLLRLVISEHCPYLLLVIAHRCEEPGDDQLLAPLVEAAREAQVEVTTVTLAALSRDAVAALLADTLGASRQEVEPLAGVVRDKTAGNCFFLRRFLDDLRQRGHIYREAETGAWRWSLASIEAAQVTENVIDLMIDAIRRLSPEEQRMLRFAACFSGRIELEVLAAVARSDPEAVAAQLWASLREGLLIVEGRSSTAGSATYRFGHDRVREAALALSSDSERRKIHARIGRELRERHPEPGSPRHFEMVDQLNLAAAGIELPGEQSRLVEINAQAAASARAANAHGAALSYLRRALDLAPAVGDGARTLLLRLHSEAGEAACLVGEHAAADRHLATARELAISSFERAEVANLQVIGSSTRGDFARALRWGREGLAGLGVELPDDAAAAWTAELVTLRSNLESHGSAGLAAAPPMTDELERARLELLSNLLSPAYVTDPHLFAFLAARAVNLSFERGRSVYSAFACASAGMALTTLERDYATAHTLGQTGAELSRAFADPVQECRTLHVVGSFVNHWRAPLASSIPLLRRALERGVTGGELQFAVYAAGTLSLCRFHRGDPLPDVAAEIESFIELARRAGARDGEHYLIAYRQAIRALQGGTSAPHLFDDRSFDERRHLMECGSNPLSLALYHTARLVACFIARKLDDAVAAAEAAEEVLGAVGGIIPAADHNFLSSLSLAASRPPAEALERIEKNQQVLRLWADNCPENYRHKALLVEAEIARLQGRYIEAAALYDDAIDAAADAGVLEDEAIANEVAGRFWRGHGRSRISNIYLPVAADLYARWGALVKVRALREEFPDAVPETRTDWSQQPAPVSGSLSVTLDMMAFHEVSASLSSEVVLERLLDRLLEVSMEMSGATRGALLLERNGALELRAFAPGDAAPRIPFAISERALSAAEPVVIGDAAHPPPDLAANGALRDRTGSILAIPITRKSRRIGVIYLENHLATHVFGAGRIGALTLLSAQIGISVENSLLFEGLQSEIAERRRAEGWLRFLADASAALAESLDERATVSRIAQLAVPSLAEWTVVVVTGQDGDDRVAVSHDGSDHGVRESLAAGAIGEIVARTRAEGSPQVISDLDRRRSTAPPGCRSLLAVPLNAGDQCVGVLVCGSSSNHSPAQLVVATDLGNRAGIALEKCRLYRQTRDAVEVRDQFLSIASHELRTPLTSLQLASQGLLRGRVPPGERPMRRVAQIVHRQLTKLTKLVDDLLDVSRLHTGRLELSLEQTDLAELASEVIERFSDEMTRAGSEVSLNTRGKVTGLWDRARLDQVMTNLLSNALKFGPGKPIEVDLEARDGQVEMAVTDHGIGIPAENVEQIFGQFERAAPASQYGGLGLGLYISRQIVSALGGTISAESIPGRRTTLRVVLPREGRPTPVNFSGGMQ